MDNTPYFLGFKPRGGRRRISSLEKYRRELEKLKVYQIQEFRNIFKGLIPAELLSGTVSNSRNRIFTFEVTFWAFLSQSIWNNCSCAEVVKSVQSWLKLPRSKSPVSSNTAGYCKARMKLPYDKIFSIFTSVKDKSTKLPPEKLWFGRHVKIVDGTSLRLADTAENQKVWPQPSEQKQGCGTPVIKLQGLICLATGTLLDWAQTPLNVHDSRAWRCLWDFFSSGDLILADRGYSSFSEYSLLRQRGIDVITRLNGSRKLNKKTATRIGKNEWLVTWKRPHKSLLKIQDIYDQLDHEITVRIITSTIHENGYRPKTFIISTTLVDHERYPAYEVEQLYLERWGIEVRFRDIKNTMGMAEIRGKSPQMVNLEIAMMAISYNLVRALINEALTEKPDMSYKRVSFAGALYQIRQQIHKFSEILNPNEANELRYLFLRSLVDFPVPDRPGRSEPRLVKKRYSKYNRLNAKRSEYKTNVGSEY